MNKLEQLLYVGNKKVKELRDQRQAIWEYFNQGESLPAFITVPKFVECVFTQDVLASAIKNSLRKGKAEIAELQDDDDIDAWQAQIAYDDFIASIKDLADDLQNQMDEFYSLKSDLVQANFTAIGVHTSKHFRLVYDRSDDDYRELHSSFVLFKGEEHTFHITEDEYQGDWDELEELGEIDQISSDITVETEYNNLSLAEIVEMLKSF